MTLRPLCIAIGLAVGLLGSVSAKAVTISISCGAVGAEFAICKEGAEAWAKKTGNEVKLVSTPDAVGDRLALYQQWLGAGSTDIDVLQIDVIWPGVLGSQFIDLKPYSKGAENNHFKAIVENNTVKDKLVAMPWYTDVGVLFYRKDLLDKYGEKPPSTWEELAATAQKIQDGERKAGNDKMWGYVFQGKSNESLTCNALEWIDSYGGGTFVDGDGKITVNNPKAVAALSEASSFVGKVSPEGVTAYGEEDARGVFQSGNAVFMRNWPYAYALGNSADSPIKGKFSVMALPKGGADGHSSGTLGGWQLAVSKYSTHPSEAADLVMYLTSREEQKRRAIVGSYIPTIPDLYKDKDVLAAQPVFGDFYDAFVHAVARPSRVTGTNYNKVSTAVWNAAGSALSGSAKPDAALASLETQLTKIRRNGW